MERFERSLLQINRFPSKLTLLIVVDMRNNKTTVIIVNTKSPLEVVEPMMNRITRKNANTG
jgi:hypothetical protein